MNIFSRWFKKPTIEAATALPPIPEPKIKSSKGVTPSYLGKEKSSKISNNANNITNLVLSDFARSEATMNQTIRKLCLASPDLSHALELRIRAAIPEKYTAIAYDEFGVVSEEGTRLAQSFLLRLNYSSADYTRYTSTTDIRSFASAALYDNLRYGAMCIQLVLGSTRLPSHIKAIPVRLLSWADNTPDVFPLYKDPVKGEIELNHANIFYSSSIQDGETPYADSPIQSAIQAALWDADFVDTLRRAALKNLMPRLVITVNSEKYMATLPLEVQTSKELLKQHMDSTINELENQMASLDPADALILFDILSSDTLADTNNSSDRSIDILQQVINGKLSAGAKILPAIIGRGESSNSASSEALLFVKAISSVQQELNILISRAVTLAVRLMGHDVNVAFRFQETNLRPELELESFRIQKQARLLELLSLGLNDDISTCIQLTGSLPPANYKKLSGTGFYKKAADTKGSNDYSNTSVDTTSGKTDSTQSQKDSEAK